MDFIRKAWWFEVYLWIFNYTLFHYSKCWLFTRQVVHLNPWYRLVVLHARRPYACAHILMPRNPNPSFVYFYFFTLLIVYASILIYFSMFMSLCLHVLLFVCSLYAKLGLDSLSCHRHAYDMIMHRCLGTVMWWGKWGKSCIHMNMYLFGRWFCLGLMNMNMLVWMPCLLMFKA